MQSSSLGNWSCMQIFRTLGQPPAKSKGSASTLLGTIKLLNTPGRYDVVNCRLLMAIPNQFKLEMVQIILRMRWHGPVWQHQVEVDIGEEFDHDAPKLWLPAWLSKYGHILFSLWYHVLEIYLPWVFPGNAKNRIIHLLCAPSTSWNYLNLCLFILLINISNCS